MSNSLLDDKVVITGISGSFPKSKDVYKFKDNLFGKVDMLEMNTRFHDVYPELPVYAGIVPDISHYDAGFFGMHVKEADAFDAQGRMLLEKTIEAIFDAGVNPSDLVNTKTGVYIAFSGSEIVNNGSGRIPSYHFTQLERSIIVNRISYFLKVKGPSFAVDSACSSSLCALEQAFRDLRLGEIDNAIVGGSNLCLNPMIFLEHARLGLINKGDVCRPFDKSGKGYVKSDAVVVIFLQKFKNAKRMYAQVVYCKTNSDGFKEQGIVHPSQEGQQDLLLSFYDECGVDRYSLTYLETHGTGTAVGDPVECGAIDEVFTKNRKTPLMIGSVKSNMGHTEYAAGLCSIVKCILAMETGLIPPNIHYDVPRAELVGIHEGRLQVVTETTPFANDRGLIGLSSFGFGGVNGHALLQWNTKKEHINDFSNDYLPIIVCASGRTKEAVTVLLDQLCNNKFDAGYIKLLQEIFKKNVSNHLFRGYSILSKYGEMFRSSALFIGIIPTLYLAFGELNYWYDVGKELLPLPVYRSFIQRIQEKLSKRGMNVIKMFLVESKDRATYHILGGIVVQIALADVMKLLQVVTNQVIGFSFGHIALAYYNNLLTLEEAIDTAFVLNEATNFATDIQKPDQKNEKDNLLLSNTPEMISENLRRNLKHHNSELRNRVFHGFSQILTKSISGLCPDHFIDRLAENFFDDIECADENIIILQIGSGTIRENNGKIEVLSVTTPELTRLNFLKSIGRLYEAGLNPDLTPLYPEIKLPVGRGTKMISPYIRWKHDKEWYVRSHKVEVSKRARFGDRTVVIDLEDQKWSYIEGYVIDGRNFFPAMGYLFVIWQSLSFINDTSMSLMDVIFEDCRFLRTIEFPKERRLQLRITIQKESGNFEVVEGDELVVTGRIYANNVDETYIPSNPLQFDDVPLNSKDIYRELRLHGYFYKDKFRGLQEYHVSSCLAFIKWEENWVTFIDNMLQMKIFEVDSRGLFLPTYISKIEIPAKRQLEWITREYINAGKLLNLPVLSSKTTGIISCGKVTIQGPVYASLSRKNEAKLPVLQKYKFVPNVTSLDIQESVTVNLQIIVENSMIYKGYVVEVIDEFTVASSVPLAPIVNLVHKDMQLIQLNFKILSKIPHDVDVPVENGKLRFEKNCQLLIVSKISKRAEFLKDAFSALKSDGFIISREDLSYEITKGYPDLTLLTLHKTNNEVLVLFQRKLPVKNTIDCKISSDNFAWISALQDILKNNENNDIVLYSHNDPHSGILGLVSCLRREPIGKNIRCVFLMDENDKLSMVASYIIEQLNKNMTMNVYKNGQWGTYRHLWVNEINTIESEHSYLGSVIKGDISSLRWFQGPLNYIIPSYEDKQLVYIYYSSVNFKDVMLASGKLNVDIDMKKRSDQECVLGFEFSGRDISGNRVMGISLNAAISNLVFTHSHLIYNVPDFWTLEEAATVPFVYLTAIYAMFIRGHLQQGERILIHSGSEEIGQAAIRLAIHHKCTVFTTVDSQTERDFLKSIFPELKDSHIGNSLDCTLEQMVIKETNGCGVDMVLNSLVDDKLIASVRCLARGGRFMEIGKFDTSKNSSLNLLLFEKEASFHGIMLDELIEANPFQIKQLTHFMKVLLDLKVIKPLNRQLFTMEESEQAFKYMSTGKHMRKVVIQIREPEENILTIQFNKKYRCISRYWCDPDKVYIIVGGLGGFGLELSDWLVRRGARKLVLTSRKGISTGYQKYRIGIWKSYGTVVKISTTDATTVSGCEKLIKDSEKLGTIQGIFNLGVVLEDALFENQTVESFLAVFGPKVLITQNLDELTRTKCPDLRDFVVFSSLVSDLGNPGQTNYGISNSAVERICEYRRRDGYPALAIQWGGVGEVGIVADREEDNKSTSLSGLLEQPISSCLNVLDNFLTQQEETVLCSGVVADKEVTNVTHNMIDTIAHALGIYDVQTVSVNSTLAELGMDSITLVKIKQILERDFDIFINANEIRALTLDRLRKLQEDNLVDGNMKWLENSIMVNQNKLFRSQF